MMNMTEKRRKSVQIISSSAEIEIVRFCWNYGVWRMRMEFSTAGNVIGQAGEIVSDKTEFYWQVFDVKTVSIEVC